jgi:hypothetical protein
LITLTILIAAILIIYAVMVDRKEKMTDRNNRLVYGNQFDGREFLYA